MSESSINVIGGLGKCITVNNEKGGIGKSSVVFNIGWQLASLGKKVLLIDMDGQEANLTAFCGIKKDESLLTTYDVLVRGKAANEAIKAVKENLDLLPATSEISQINQTARTKTIKSVINELRSEYDFIFIDAPGSTNWGQFLALSASDYSLIPMLPDMTSIDANKGIIDTIEEVREVANANLKVLGILFNKNENRTNLSKTVKSITQKIAVKMDTTVFENAIRSATVMGEAYAMHKGITDYKPKSDVADDVRQVTEEFLRRV